MAAVLIVIIFVGGYKLGPGLNWLCVISFMIVFFVVLGKLTTEYWLGILINERNKMSLSRLQLVIWTLVVLSAFLTIALYNISSSDLANPLEIAVPEQLWYLLGISATSLVGSPLVLSTKRNKTGADVEQAMKISTETKIEINDAKSIAGAGTTTGVTGLKSSVTNDQLKQAQKTIDNLNRFGTLTFNLDKAAARFKDMFMGDEVGNEKAIDMAKVQQFFFTLIIAFSYMILLYTLIANADSTGISSFPKLDDSSIALLGISSAGYLTNKAYDKTKTK